jgi:hypothetical protein
MMKIGVFAHFHDCYYHRFGSVGVERLCRKVHYPWKHCVFAHFQAITKNTRNVK